MPKGKSEIIIKSKIEKPKIMKKTSVALII